VKILPNWLREFTELPADDAKLAADLTQAGMAVESVAAYGDSTVFEMEIGANRPDAMNHYGVAREASAIYGKPLKPFTPKIPAEGGTAPFAIEIEDAAGCARYTAQVVRGVNIGASPPKVQWRLEKLGSRPISNVADATNYALHEFGHPTHAFDLDKLAGGKIIVRRARPGEQLKTLDGVERRLHPEDVVIADADRAVALAGVMGGFDSMITAKTRNVLIESAWFDPAAVRKTSRRLDMHTDASHRFERGADWGATPAAARRVAELILNSAGGQLEGGLIDVVARKVGGAVLTLRRSEIRRHLGQEVPADEVAGILTRLGFAVEARGDEFSVTVPTWRLDAEREIDLIEEIARIYGYNRFPNTLPGFAGTIRETPGAGRDAAVRSTMLALGFNEAISTTFIGRDDAAAYSRSKPVELANPVSEDAPMLRNSLVPGMLGMLAWNLNRGVDAARLFEHGHIFDMTGEAVSERAELCFGATGTAGPSPLEQKPRPYSFFDMKGDVETLLGRFQHGSLYFDASGLPAYLHPGRAARAVMDGATVAHFGQLHPDVAAARKLRQPVYIAEVRLERLYRHELRKPQYRPIPRFPAVERDFSFIFSDEVTFERISAAVRDLGIAELRSFAPVEVFRGGSVPTGRYSMLLRAGFQSGERTLRDDEVAAWSERIIEALKALGGTLRA